MTHKDIYTKFMIEYDKANVTSSYPSLTEYEVATVLDKAYNALIAQKVTGNNIRRVGFEGDSKAIVDIAPLITSDSCEIDDLDGNVIRAEIPEDMLYYVSGSLESYMLDAMDQEVLRRLPIKLVTHEIADKFIASPYNLPWVKIPVCYIEDKYIYVIYDSINKPLVSSDDNVDISYIKKPNKFVKDLTNLISDSSVGPYSYFNPPIYTEKSHPDNWDSLTEQQQASWTSDENARHALYIAANDKYNFECNDTVAEELISLAVTFALENVESQRLNSKLNMRGLEA